MTSTTSAIAAAQERRGTVFLEEAVLLRKQAYAGQQSVLRLAAPLCARNAVAGSFVHIQCDKSIAMRRPLSIMRRDADDGWIEILFKIVGPGLASLSKAEPGQVISLIGPIGRGFETHKERPLPLLIGGGVGIPPMVFLAEQLLADGHDWTPLVLMGSEIPFPFETATSSRMTRWLTSSTTSTMPLLEDWGVTARLATLAGFAGCFEGYVTDLARLYLDSLADEQRHRIEIFSCGPTVMLKAVARLAAEYELPCQVSLEEFMACGIGGCAGCAVEIQTPAGTAMKRVCVDGPVFEAGSVFF